MMLNEEDEYSDDPITLLDYEQRRFSYHSDDTIIIDDDEYTYTDFDEYISSYPKDTSKLPQPFKIIKRNMELLNKCQPMQIKLVDCEQFPWYYKKDEAYENVDSDMEDDIIIINEPPRIEDASTGKANEHLHFKTDDKHIQSDLDLTDMNQLKIEIEKQYALYKKIVSEIDVDDNEELYDMSVDISDNNALEPEFNNNICDGKTPTPEYNIDEEKQRFEIYARVIEKAYEKLKSPENNSLSQNTININSKNTSFNMENLTPTHVHIYNEVMAECKKSDNSVAHNEFNIRSSVENKFVRDIEKLNSAAKNKDHKSMGNKGKGITDELKEVVFEKSNNKSADYKSAIPKSVRSQIIESNSNLLPSVENTLIQANKQLSCSCKKQLSNANRIIPHFHKSTPWMDSNIILANQLARMSSKSKNKTLRLSYNQSDLPIRQHQPKITEKKSHIERNSTEQDLFNNLARCQTSITRNNNPLTNIVSDKYIEIKNNTKLREKPLKLREAKHPMVVQDGTNNMKCKISQPVSAESMSNLNTNVLNNFYQNQHNSNTQYDKCIKTTKNVDFITKNLASAARTRIHKDYLDEPFSLITNSGLQINAPDNISQCHYINSDKFTSFLRPPYINPIYSPRYTNNFQQGPNPHLPNVVNSNLSQNPIFGNNLQCSTMPKEVVFQKPNIPNAGNPYLSQNQFLNNGLRYPSVPKEMGMFGQAPRTPIVNFNSDQKQMLSNNLRRPTIPRRKVRPILPPGLASLSRPLPPFSQQTMTPMPNYVPVSKNNHSANGSTISRALKNIYDLNVSSAEIEKSMNMRGNEIVNTQRNCDEIAVTKKQSTNIGLLNNDNSKLPSELENKNPIIKSLLARESRPPESKNLSSSNHIIDSNIPLNKLNKLTSANKKGYSPPILPIPTFEVLAQMKIINMQNNLSHNSLKQQIEQPIRNHKRKASNDGCAAASKISLEEYKKRSMEKKNS